MNSRATSDQGIAFGNRRQNTFDGQPASPLGEQLSPACVFSHRRTVIKVTKAYTSRLASPAPSPPPPPEFFASMAGSWPSPPASRVRGTMRGATITQSSPNHHPITVPISRGCLPNERAVDSTDQGHCPKQIQPSIPRSARGRRCHSFENEAQDRTPAVPYREAHDTIQTRWLSS